MAATDLYSIAREYLDAVNGALALSVGGPISRTYVAPGPPAWDCEQATVHVGGPLEADTAPLAPPLAMGLRTAVVGAVYMTNLTATVIRCVPTVEEKGNLLHWPDPADMEAAAQATLADVWTIWAHIRTQWLDGLLFTRPDGEPRDLILNPAVPLPTQGGYGGWQVEVLVQLDGWRTA